MAAALFVASTLIGKRLTTLPTKLTLPTGTLLAAIGGALNWLLLANPFTLLPGLILTGIGLGIAGPATSTAVLAAAPPDRAGMASGAMATVRQLGQTLGVALLGSSDHPPKPMEMKRPRWIEVRWLVRVENPKNTPVDF
jgi:predicted MFS family arabinose efflux permease